MNTSYSIKQLIAAMLTTAVVTTVAIAVFIKNSPNTLLSLSKNVVAAEQCNSSISADSSDEDNIYFVGCGGFF